MAVKALRTTFSQAALNVSEQFHIDTGLGVTDQKTVWSLKGMKVRWRSIGADNQNSAGMWLNLSRKDGQMVADWNDPAFIDVVSWWWYGTSATELRDVSAVREVIFDEEFLIANSKLSVMLETTSLDAKAVVDFRLYYEEVKVSEVEFLKLQAGYCLC
jgi:hypothetical protein